MEPECSLPYLQAPAIEVCRNPFRNWILPEIFVFFVLVVWMDLIPCVLCTANVPSVPATDDRYVAFAESDGVVIGWGKPKSSEKNLSSLPQNPHGP